MRITILLIGVITLATFATACTYDNSSSENTTVTTEKYIEQTTTVLESESSTAEQSTAPMESEYPTQEQTIWDMETKQERWAQYYTELLEETFSQPLCGQLPPPNEALSKELEIALGREECVFEDRAYKMIANNYGRTVLGGWKIDLSHLSFLGKSKEGLLIYGLYDESQKLIFVVVDQIENERYTCAWYGLEDYHMSLNYDDFTVLGDCAYPELIWKYHTSNDLNLRNSSEWMYTHTYYWLELVSKKIPALSYEIGYAIRDCDATVTVYNITKNATYIVPVN